MATWATYLEDNRSRFTEELLTFLRIPSVSSLPAHAADVGRAARWAADRLTSAGLEHARILPADRHPVVYGDWLHAPGKPTLLIYGHYDVQPVDPLDQWTSPPFEPVICDGRVYARGATDMKSGVLLSIIAVEALLQTMGELPVNIKYLLEGEEEIGSPSLPAVLRAQRELFACDLVVNPDGVQRGEDRPSLSVSSRGNCGVQLDVRGANTDLHSGFYGGMAPNAIKALVELLASMHGPDGRVRVRGFYDEVRPLTAAQRAAIAASAADEEAVRRRLGLAKLVGEVGYTANERVAARPTLEINGIWGGFQGEGTKTVIPAEAHAKITCRLVPDQEPDQIIEQIAAHVAEHTPEAVTVTVTPLAGRARPARIPIEHPGNQVATAVLSELYGKAPVYVWSGATGPVRPACREILGADTVSLAFGLPDEREHAPNEFCRLARFEQGQRGYCQFLEGLGQRSPTLLRGATN